MLTLLPTLVFFFGSLAAVLGQASAPGPVPENITIGALPTFSTCQLAMISWSGGKSPYRVYIYPADWANQTDWIVELPLTTRTQNTWNVNLDAGFGIVVNVWDGINDAYSEPAWIQDSGDSSCLLSNGRTQSGGLNSTEMTGTTSMSSAIVISTPSSSATPAPPIQSTPPPRETVPETSASSAPAPAATVTVNPNGAAPRPSPSFGGSMIHSALLLCCLVVFVGIW